MAQCDSSLAAAGTTFATADDGRLDATADRVWSDRPKRPASLSRAEIAEACTRLASCLSPGALPDGAQTAYFDACTSINPYEERAIPYGSNFYFGPAASDFLPEGQQAAETWASFVRAVVDSDRDCARIQSILTPRPREVTCSEAGCWWYSTELPIPDVRCEGDVAVLTTEGKVLRRDCAKAMLSCDESSATGCSDRHPASCDPNALARCDGTVKLGCDRYGRVTYRDCGWVEGGECVEDDVGARCEYELDA